MSNRKNKKPEKPLDRQFIPRTCQAFHVNRACAEITCVWNCFYYKTQSSSGCIKFTNIDRCNALETIEALKKWGEDGIADFGTIREIQIANGIHDGEKYL